MNNIENCLLIVILTLFIPFEAISQNEKLTTVDYEVIAEGIDSPFKNFQVVCYNKYFNIDRLPIDFQEQYNLTDKKLFKKKMLIEILYQDTENKGLDKIDLISIAENETEIFIEYNIVNSDKTSDQRSLAPFIVVQVPKTRKSIRFVADGVELGKTNDLYINR